MNAPTLTALHSWEEVDDVFERAERCETDADRVALLCDYYYDTSEPLDLDPFGAEYRAEMVRLHSRITGRERYTPAESERAGYLDERGLDVVAQPPPFGNGASDAIGEYFIAWGYVMRVLAIPPGGSILEYGPGGGQLSVALARHGLDVSVVDIEPVYIEAIEEQCSRLGVPITARVGEFGDVPEPGRRYDAVLFFEAFHHSLDHAELLRRLHTVVSDSGVVAIAGEPIIEPGSYWEPTIPFAWGPRCDLLSLYAMRRYGWLELGFREAYFYDVSERAGWVVTKEACALTSRGTTYVLRRRNEPRRLDRVLTRLTGRLRGRGPA
jgi:2-polyprenyl-3-methyl-5-hydroxy-6-metoxy-1,4-benzoquinol methylase